MKPARVERHLDEIGRFLFEPLIHPRKPPRTWELISWDVEQGLQVIVRRDEHLLLVELEDRDDDRPCYDRTRHFNICARRHFAAESPMNARDRRLLDAIVGMVRQREVHLPDAERSTTGRKAAVREIEVERVLMPEGAGHYYLNPYVGCMIGCEFCYVGERADLSRRLEGQPRLPWGRYVDVKVNAPEVLREEVERRPPGVVRMSPIITDPYQPLEKRYRITRRCLEVLQEADFTPVVLTRAVRALEDLDLFKRFSVACVGFSIPSDDDHYRILFEPGGDPVDDRIEALARCHEAGLYTMAVIQPTLPMNPERLVERVAPYVGAVRVDRMHHLDRYRYMYEAHGLEHAMEPEFFDDLRERLVAGFRSHGVVVDAMDDLARILADRADVGTMDRATRGGR
ncbi:MAG: radical SAM protein [Myxococcota bacterium]